MKKISLVIGLLLWLPHFAGAQPGGGGGLVIYNVLNKDLQPILDDPSFRLRSFILNGDGPQAPVYEESILHINYGSIDIPGFRNYIINTHTSSHRIYLRYKDETMILDLPDLINENPGGFQDRMDTVVFMKGYFRFVRNRRVIDEEFNDKSGYALLKRGLTPSVNEIMSKKGWLTHLSTVDTSFLQEKNLGALFFISRANRKMWDKKYEEALADIIKAMRLPITNPEKEYAFILLNDIYTAIDDIEKAAGSITSAIKISMQPYRKYEYYEKRINLYVKQGAFEKALADYDSLAILANDVYLDNSHTLLQRAQFRMDHFQQYQQAIHEIKNIIATRPSRGYYDQYMTAPFLFWLGIAEYRNKQVTDAFQHWSEAADLQGSHYAGFAVTQEHCDSIIRKHPSEAAPYVWRSITHRQNFYKNVSQNPNPDTLFIQKALTDLSKASELGYTGYQLYFYRAACFMEIKNYRDALQQVNEAITKNQSDSRLFWLRYQAKVGLGLVDPKNQYTDPDVLMSEKLSKQERVN